MLWLGWQSNTWGFTHLPSESFNEQKSKKKKSALFWQASLFSLQKIPTPAKTLYSEYWSQTITVPRIRYCIIYVVKLNKHCCHFCSKGGEKKIVWNFNYFWRIICLRNVKSYWQSTFSVLKPFSPGLHRNKECGWIGNNL